MNKHQYFIFRFSNSETGSSPVRTQSTDENSLQRQPSEYNSSSLPLSAGSLLEVVAWRLNLTSVTLAQSWNTRENEQDVHSINRLLKCHNSKWFRLCFHNTNTQCTHKNMSKCHLHVLVELLLMNNLSFCALPSTEPYNLLYDIHWLNFKR